MAGPNCHACAHFRVTWDKRVPYECRAFGMRTSRLPSVVVRQESGRDCQLFRPKARPSAAGESPTPEEEVK